MNVVLKNFLSFFSFSSSNIESSISNMSFDKVSFICPLSFISSSKSKPTACVLSLISYDFSSIVLFVLENAESTIIARVDKGEFSLVPMNLELLTFFLLECVNFKLVVFAHSQAFIVIKNRDNLISRLLFWLEFSRNFWNLFLSFNFSISLNVVSRNYQP